jgi:hypothetical protein
MAEDWTRPPAMRNGRATAQPAIANDREPKPLRKVPQQ